MPQISISLPKEILALLPVRNRSRYFQDLLIKEFHLDPYTFDPLPQETVKDKVLPQETVKDKALDLVLGTRQTQSSRQKQTSLQGFGPCSRNSPSHKLPINLSFRALTRMLDD
jgi:hypothetical protein